MPTINSIMDDLEEENKNLREKIKRLDNDNAALQHTVDDFVVKCKDLQSAYDKEHSRWVELAENYDRLETKYGDLERSHKRLSDIQNRLYRENEDLKAKMDNSLGICKIRQLEGENAELRKKCTYFEKLSTERLKATEELHQQLDTAEKEREAIREESLRNIREGYKTECDLKELRQKYDYLERSHKRLGDIRNRLAKENEDLKAKKDNALAFYRIKQLEETNARLIKENKEANDTLEKANRDRNDLLRKLDTECDKRCDLEEKLDDIGKRYYESAHNVSGLVREKGDLQRQLDSLNTAMGRLRERYEEEVVCRRKWAKLAGYRDKRIEELLKTGYGIDADEVYKLKGMEELWAMLGTMFSADPVELGKIFGWCSINNIAHYTPDVREFLKKYETWKSGKDEKEAERKRLDYMRDYLTSFCRGQMCLGCPLESNEFNCGCHHKCFQDRSLIPDEDLQRYYEKARKEI